MSGGDAVGREVTVRHTAHSCPSMLFVFRVQTLMQGHLRHLLSSWCSFQPRVLCPCVRARLRVYRATHDPAD